MSPSMGARRALAVAAVAVAASCTNFDREDRVHDMRVLAIKTEPPEILYSPLYLTAASQRPPGFPLPTVDVKVQVFAFDPRGGHITTSFQLCPEGSGDSTCRLYDPAHDIASEPAAARADVAAALTPVTNDEVIAPDAEPVGHIEHADYTVQFTPHIIDFVIPDDANGNPQPSIFPLLPRFVFEARNHDVVDQKDVLSERAFKRMPISLDLTSPDLPPDVVANLARSLGIELCTAPIPDAVFDRQGRADCLLTRTANQNPTFAGFHIEPDASKLTEGTADTAAVSVELGIGSLLRADPGAQIALTPVFAPNTVERYQVVSFDIQTSKIILLNRVEDIACNWYSTRGDIGTTLTALQLGPSLGTTWSLPADAVSGERDSLYLVILDQRGGTALGEITVEYR